MTYRLRTPTTRAGLGGVFSFRSLTSALAHRAAHGGELYVVTDGGEMTWAEWREEHPVGAA